MTDKVVARITKDVSVDVCVYLSELETSDLEAELKRRNLGPMLTPVGVEFNHEQFIESLYQAVVFDDRARQDQLVRELLREVGNKTI
ncbi:hypothetical protein CF123_18095 [Aeromonas veronii]|uniref:Uncharacterized protein n=1 Tax=Aeromonas veronii TaxID=654 RepID=A0AAX2UQE4_AERVE|nr:hypothetical protein [Aeromonas veronii]TND52029.1 hypothetical protein CF123_18095 [Aeromonas veronii]